jgi:hypothetical protein
MSVRDDLKCNSLTWLGEKMKPMNGQSRMGGVEMKLREDCCIELSVNASETSLCDRYHEFIDGKKLSEWKHELEFFIVKLFV